MQWKSRWRLWREYKWKNHKKLRLTEISEKVLKWMTWKHLNMSIPSRCVSLAKMYEKSNPNNFINTNFDNFRTIHIKSKTQANTCDIGLRDRIEVSYWVFVITFICHKLMGDGSNNIFNVGIFFFQFLEKYFYTFLLKGLLWRVIVPINLSIVNEDWIF